MSYIVASKAVKSLVNKIKFREERIAEYYREIHDMVSELEDFMGNATELIYRNRLILKRHADFSILPIETDIFSESIAYCYHEIIEKQLESISQRKQKIRELKHEVEELVNVNEALRRNKQILEVQIQKMSQNILQVDNNKTRFYLVASITFAVLLVIALLLTATLRENAVILLFSGLTIASFVWSSILVFDKQSLNHRKDELTEKEFLFNKAIQTFENEKQLFEQEKLRLKGINETTIKTVNEKLQIARQQKEKSLAQEKQYQENLAQLNEQIANLKEQIEAGEHAKRKAENLELDYKRFFEKYHNRESEIQTLQSDLNASTHENKCLSNIIESLRAEIENIQKQREDCQKEKQELESKYQNLRSNCASLENQNKDFQKQREDSQSNYSELEIQYKRIQTEYRELERTVQKLSSQIPSLETKNEKLQSQLETIQSRYSDLDNRIKLVQKEKQELEKEKRILNSQKKSLESENEKLQKQNRESEIQTLQSDLNASTHENKCLSNIIESLRAEIENIQKQREDCQKEKQELENEKRILNSQKKSLESENEKLQKQNISIQSKYSNLNIDFKTVQNKNQTLKNENDRLDSQISSLEIEKEELLAENSDYVIENSKFKVQIQNLQEECLSLRKEKINNNNFNQRDYHNLQVRFNTLQKENEELRYNFLKLDSKKAQEIIRRNSLDEDTDNNSQPIPVVETEPAPSEINRANSEQDSFFDIADEIIKKTSYSNDELIALYRRFNMSVSSGNGKINRWTDDVFGDYLINEENNRFVIDQEIANMIRNQEVKNE